MSLIKLQTFVDDKFYVWDFSEISFPIFSPMGKSYDAECGWGECSMHFMQSVVAQK
jgi:hypothetical protein